MAIGLLTPSTGLSPVPLGEAFLVDVGKGLFTLVDAALMPMIERVQPLRAVLVKETGSFYVYGTWQGKEYLLHRLIMNLRPSDPLQVDHLNGFTLDNRLSNLRVVTNRVNTLSQHRRRANSTGFTGVSLHPPSGKYVARIRINGKRTCLGYFDTPEQAAVAYTSKHEELVS